jgi:hypothetical protein
MGLHTPLSVLLIGGIVGLFVFAVSSAFTVWIKRNQSASEVQGQTSSLLVSLLKLALMGGAVFGVIYGLKAIQPHTILQQEGLLVGKDLFTVRSRAGFIAEYPPLGPKSTATTEYLEQGKALVIFRRNPDPTEIAAAAQQRDTLQEQLNLARIQRPPVDPTLQNQFASLERRLDNLNQRQKELANQQESYLREEAKNSPANNSENRQIEQQLLTLDLEHKQTALRAKNAELELRSATAHLERGSTSRDGNSTSIAAYNALRSSYNGLRSKADELRERVRLLEQQKAAIRASLSEAQQRTRTQLAKIDRGLMEVTAAKQQLVAEHDEVSKRLQEESAQGNDRRLSRIRWLELQLAEMPEWSSSPESHTPTELRAPWNGYVGYRDLSPASVRPDTGPLVVMYKPDHIWVELQVPIHLARDLTGDNTSIKLFAHSTSTTQVEFSGHLESMLPLPDDEKVELRITTFPPASLVRKLALGEDVQAQVKIRSQGSSIADRLEMISASLHTSGASWPYVRVSVVPVIASLCCCVIIIKAVRSRWAPPKETAVNTRNVDNLSNKNDSRMENNGNIITHLHTNASNPSNISEKRGFIYDFTNNSPSRHATQLDISRQEASHTLEDMVSLQLQCIIEEHNQMTRSPQSMNERQKQHAVNGMVDRSFRDWWALGTELNRSIITNDGDITLLDVIHRYLEQQGIWVTPFIASALSTDIHDDILLGYSLKLCVRRMSEVQHKGELGQAICDLARYLRILQLFFPDLVKQIAPNLQQGLTMALHIATAKAKAETEADNLLAMLREVLCVIGNDRQNQSM